MTIRNKMLWAAIAAFSCLTAANGNEPESDPRGRGTNERKTKGREVLGDPQFRRGMAISPLWPAIVQNNGGFEKTNTDTIRFGRRSGKPVWQMAQWASRYDLGGTPPVRQADGSVAYANEGKRIVRSADGTLTLDITTSTEYRSPRTADGAWPHLLIQQDFTHRPNIGRIRHLYFAMDLRIEHCERRMSDEQYDESLHTAQSPFYFFMRNTNPRSPDYGLSLWVGVPSFDYRYERLSDEEYVQWDIGTATYIYAIPPRSIWGDVSFHDREWHSARLDLLPLIRRGVAAMQAKGQFVHTMPEDLELTGMNFGWEVPGTFGSSSSPIRRPLVFKSERRVVRNAAYLGQIRLPLRDRTTLSQRPDRKQETLSHTGGQHPNSRAQLSSVDMRGATFRKAGTPALRNRPGRRHRPRCPAIAPLSAVRTTIRLVRLGSRAFRFGRRNMAGSG